MEKLDIKTIKRELLRARVNLIAGLAVVAAAGALGHKLWVAGEPVTATIVVVATIFVVFTIDELEEL